MAGAPLSDSWSFRLGQVPQNQLEGQTGRSRKPLISAAHAEVAMASVHLDQRREAVSGRRVAFEAQSGGFVARAIRWPCSCRPGCLRAWRLPSAPGSPMWGPQGPGRCPSVCAAWTAGSSTGLCCVRDGLACSRTGCCSR